MAAGATGALVLVDEASGTDVARRLLPSPDDKTDQPDVN
jgi:hypothetical protein